ncbi:MAG TPA: hypothetical protein VM784_10640 [Actinomycetota bacterium]|nr:hypothetical protein [Actinomycetota bacterium]
MNAGRMAAVVLVAILMAGPSAADEKKTSVTWDASDCDETAALLPKNGLEPGDLLVVVVYRCDSVLIGDLRNRNFAVSEISVLHSDGTWTLLRHVTNSSRLVAELQGLGLEDSFRGNIEYETGDPLRAPNVHVSFRGKTYTLSGEVGPSPSRPLPTTGGAAYTYDGRKGTIEIRYANHSQASNPAYLTVTAVRDAALRKWMGTHEASGGGLVATGEWTGTATLRD